MARIVRKGQSNILSCVHVPQMQHTMFMCGVTLHSPPKDINNFTKRNPGKPSNILC